MNDLFKLWLDWLDECGSWKYIECPKEYHKFMGWLYKERANIILIFWKLRDDLEYLYYTTGWDEWTEKNGEIRKRYKL